MKKFLFLLMTGVVLSSGAYAKHHCGCDDCDCKVEQKMRKKGGFEVQAPALMSVQNVLDSADGTYVSVEGYLTAQLNEDEYSFTDGAKNVIVKIDDKIWRGQRVTPKDEIIIYGKTDREANRVMIDVKKLMLVK
ncbi:MAG: NirD/YgiW/YdeI family stress tolerance protein [Alphaproteobacteria bacterium]|nr:NirD/YgiW/YdeI family stress tolerance protein [Alphaproteobacteria bacterium]